MHGSALGVSWEKAHVSAILDSWYSGEEGGAAVAETLSGKNNPAGRLPVTFYKDVHQLPHFEDYSMRAALTATSKANHSGLLDTDSATPRLATVISVFPK